jgi:hypothetical protein
MKTVFKFLPSPALESSIVAVFTVTHIDGAGNPTGWYARNLAPRSTGTEELSMEGRWSWRARCRSN